MRSYFFVTWVALITFLAGPLVVATQGAAADKVEILSNGKSYASIDDYQNQKIKKSLERTFASIDLKKFTEEELCSIITEVRKEQTADKPFPKGTVEGNEHADSPLQDQKSITEDALDLNPSQMQDMLDDYYEKHKNADPVSFDPDKVKNIIISPDPGSEALFGD